MDSFTPITITAEPTTSTPVDFEDDSGGNSTTYCVVAQRPDVPVDEEGGSGGGSTTYCVIA